MKTLKDYWQAQKREARLLTDYEQRRIAAAQEIKAGRHLGLILTSIIVLIASIIWGKADAGGFGAVFVDNCPTCYAYHDPRGSKWLLIQSLTRSTLTG